MNEFLKDIAPVLPMISVGIVILLATRKHKAWSELTAKGKKSRIAFLSAAVFLTVTGVLLAVHF